MRCYLRRNYETGTLLAAIFVVAGCGSLVDEEPRYADYILVIAGDSQTVAPGMTLPEPVVFQFLNVNRQPIHGLAITWAMVRQEIPPTFYGLEYFEPDTARTDFLGRAAVSVRLDTVPGRYIIAAGVVGQDGALRKGQRAVGIVVSVSDTDRPTAR